MKKQNILNIIIIACILFVMFEKIGIACSPPEPGTCSDSIECDECESCQGGLCDTFCNEIHPACCDNGSEENNSDDYCEYSSAPPRVCIRTPISNTNVEISSDNFNENVYVNVTGNRSFNIYGTHDRDGCQQSIEGVRWYMDGPGCNLRRIDTIDPDSEEWVQAVTVNPSFPNPGTWGFILLAIDDEGVFDANIAEVICFGGKAEFSGLSSGCVIQSETPKTIAYSLVPSSGWEADSISVTIENPLGPCISWNSDEDGLSTTGGSILWDGRGEDEEYLEPGMYRLVVEVSKDGLISSSKDTYVCDYFFHVSGINVLKVPEFLFAGATYATPIKFQVEGMGDDIWINSLEVDLYIDDVYVKTIDDLDGRVSQGDGLYTFANGTSDIYTCFINHDEYAGIEIGDDMHRTDNVFFVVRADCKPDQYTSYTSFESLPTDEEAAPKMFADDFIFVVEPGVDETTGSGFNVWSEWYLKNFNDTDQAPIQIDSPEHNFKHMVNPTFTGTNPYIFPALIYANHCNVTTPHVVTNEWVLNNLDGTIYDKAEQEIDDVENEEEDDIIGKRLHTHLEADVWFSYYKKNVFRNRIYGYRRGGYFCPSYGGKKVNVLGSSEYAMDLERTHGGFTMELFTAANIYLDTKCEVTDGFYSSGSLGAICSGAGVAAVFPINVAWAGAMFGGASASFWFIDSKEPPTAAEDRAQATLLARWTCASWGDEDPPNAVSMTAELNRTGNSDPDDQSASVILPQFYGIGDTIECFIELESVCSAKIKESVIYGIETSSEVIYECEDSANITAEEDWDTWQIRIRSF